MKNEDSLIERLRTIFVTIDVFNLRLAPLERLGYGLVALVIITVFSALIALVIKIPK